MTPILARLDWCILFLFSFSYLHFHEQFMVTRLSFDGWIHSHLHFLLAILQLQPQATTGLLPLP